MRSFLIILFLAFTGVLSAQMLENEFGKAFSDEPFFNESFIKRNKIKRIIGRFSSKAINDRIRKDSNIYIYEFNNNGQLTQKYHTVEIGGQLDTVVYQYEYNDKGQITVFRKSDQEGFFATHYTYDTLGRVIIEEKRRDINKNTDVLNFELDKSLVFNQETSSYYDAENQSKRTYYNNYDRPFKDHFKYYNELGYLVKEETILKMSRIRNYKEILYNDKGLVGTINYTSTSKNTKPTKEEFFYDDYNNLEQIKFYREGNYIVEHQLLYNKKTKLLKTVLTRDVGSNLITILAFDEYEFYP